MTNTTEAQQASTEMSKPRHTPGPWELDENRRGSHILVHAKTHGALATVVWQMADDYRQGKPSPECEANARLIAAAPGLLETLTKSEDFIRGFEGDGLQEGISELLAEIRAAIAKATGQQLKPAA